MLAACHAVAYAHSRGVLHRDLKPHNVMVDRFGETMVIDWGLARTKHDEDEPVDDLETSGALRLVGGDETLSDGRGRLGTPAYMSPEQLTGVRALIDEKSDVFGLGGLLFEVLTGRAPREEGPLHEPPRRVLSVERAVPADLAALCDKALEASRDARYQSAEELARDLDAWLHGQRVTAHAYRPAELVRRFVRQHRVTLAVGLGAVVALLTVGVAGAVRTRDQRDQARTFALLLAGDTLHRLPFAPRDPFRQELAARVSQYLVTSSESDDPTQAAEAWEHLATEHSSSGRVTEARAAASRCLELLPLPVRDERAEAVELTCRLTLIDRTEQSFEDRYRQFEQLWERRRTPSPTEPRLLVAQEGLALSLAELSTNTSRADDARRWGALGIEWGQHLTQLRPDDAEAWSLLSGAHYMQQVNEMNAVRGPEALEHARRAVDGAQRSHVLAHSPQSLLRLADILSDQYATQGIYPELVPPAEHEATAKEAVRRFEALLALDDSAPLVKRRYAEFLLAQGDVARGWAVVAEVPIADFFFQRPQLWLAFTVGKTDLVLAELAREGGDAFDHHVLLALAQVVKGDHAAAAGHARKAAGASFESFWPGLAMTRWAAAQTGPAAPAMSALTAELTLAQHTNDEARAHRALEAFAAWLEHP